MNATEPAGPSLSTPERLVTISEICSRTGFNETTIRRLVRKGQFPRLRKKGDRRVFLLESELLAWMRKE